MIDNIVLMLWIIIKNFYKYLSTYNFARRRQFLFCCVFYDFLTAGIDMGQLYMSLAVFGTVSIKMTSKWARWCLTSPVSRLFTQPLIQAQINENIKAPRHWTVCGEFTDDFPAQRASNAENVFNWWSHHAIWGCSVSMYMDSHYINKTVSRPSYRGISLTWNNGLYIEMGPVNL